MSKEAVNLIEALRAEYSDRLYAGIHPHVAEKFENDLAALLEALAGQPTQQDADDYPTDEEGYPISCNGTYADIAKAHAEFEALVGQPAQQGPVGHLLMGSKQDFVTTGSAGELEINVWHPVYTSPQRKPWVGLTEKEILDANWVGNKAHITACPAPTAEGLIAFGRAIETKLKENNNGC